MAGVGRDERGRVFYYMYLDALVQFFYLMQVLCTLDSCILYLRTVPAYYILCIIDLPYTYYVLVLSVDYGKLRYHGIMEN